MEDRREEKKSNYEILCIIKESDSEKKDKLIKEIEDVISPSKIKYSTETKKLAYKIENLESAEYLLLNFETTSEKILQIEDLIKKSFVIRHLTLNLDTEKKLKIKKAIKTQKIRRSKRMAFGKNKLERGERTRNFQVKSSISAAERSLNQ